MRAMETVMTTGPDSLDLTSGGGSFTFFVPTDEAFEALGNETMEEVLGNSAILKKVVGNHVVPGLFNSDAFKSDLVYKVPSLFSDLAVQRIKDNTITVGHHIQTIEMNRSRMNIM